MRWSGLRMWQPSWGGLFRRVETWLGIVASIGRPNTDGCRDYSIVAVQNIYSMVERDCETEIFPVCLEEGIGVVPFSPIASGFLSGKVTAQEQFGFDDVRKFVPQLSKENIEANQPILDLLHRFAVEKKATNAQISLAWMLHKYPNVVPIPGSKNQERILENLGAWNVTLSDDEFRQLQSALDECKDARTSWMRGNRTDEFR